MADTDNTQAGGLTVLIVDDEIGFTDVLAKRLLKRGIHATKTYSGTQSIQTLRNKDFHCAVLDLKMEDMDGIEVLKIFKKMAPDMAVIMLTGHGCEESAQEGMALGASAYLIKPCGLEELIDTIRKTIGTPR
ncbi:MAG TPA: response regulator [Desulfobacteraceae bacterium]|nr:response regulator [Desulfobacteraceae bacterium]